MNPGQLWGLLLAGHRGERPLIDLGSTSVSGPRLLEPRAVLLSDFARVGFGVRAQPAECGSWPAISLAPEIVETLACEPSRRHGYPLEHATATAIRRLPIAAWDARIETPAAREGVDHLVAVDPPCAGLLGLCMGARGPWRFLEDIANGDPVVDALLDWALETLLAAYNRLLAGPGRPDLVVYGDDLAYADRPFVSPAELRRFVAPRMRELLKAIRVAGRRAPILLHSCGNVSPLLGDLLDLDIEAFNLDPRPMGGLSRLRRALPASAILHGVTPLAEMGRAVMSRDVRRLTVLLEAVVATHPMIVAQGDGDVSPDREAIDVAATHLRHAPWRGDWHGDPWQLRRHPATSPLTPAPTS